MQTPSLRELFDAAMELAPRARAAFLDRQCADPQQRAALDDLLAADAGSAEFFCGGAAAAARAIGDVDAHDIPPGSRVGPFELVAVIGEGGSSTVFHAHRESDGVRQDVALKILRRGVFSPDARRQFRRERQALAQLRHAGIARLIEGGVTEDGTAYIALELVDGKPITEFVRDRQLDLRRRLQLFVHVCRAVEAAHRALIVHRDLKPANVFVTGDGQVKLLDFGIAKLLDGDDEDTRTKLPAFTAAYAAPEQRSGDPVTTATDVYALGVLLGELVTGRRFGADTGRTPSSQVRDEDAPGVLPASSPATRRALRGDLDNIVLKAVAAEPGRRYASAGALADDVERFIAGRPVAAHPPSPWYRARKFLTRHGGAAAASLIFLMAIFAALGIALWQARAARLQALHAQREAARANAANDFLVSIFAASNPTHAQAKPRGEVTARELLDQNAGKIAQRFPDDPQTRISLLGVVASAYRELGETAKYKQLHDQQLALARATDGEASPLLIEGLIDEAQLALRRRDFDAAAAALARADPLIQTAQLDESWLRAYWWLSRGLSLPNEAATREQRTQALQKSVALYARYGPMHSGYAEALYTLGSDRANEPALAENYFREAIARGEAMPERDDAELQVFYAALALAQQNRTDYAGAETSYAKAADLARHSTGEHDFHYWVPEALHAHMLHRLGERTPADAMFARLLSLLPDNAEDQQADGVASVRQHWAETLIAEGRPAAAIAPLQQALERRRAKRAREYDIRVARAALGDAYDAIGRTEDARPELDAATKEWIERFPADSFFVMQARERWGRFLLDHGDEAGARAQFREVLAQAKDRHFAPIALAHGGLARIALAHGDAATALSEARVASATFDHPTGLRDVRGGPYLWLIESAAQLRSGDAAGARATAQHALDASRRYDDPSAKSIADALAALRAAQGG